MLKKPEATHGSEGDITCGMNPGTIHVLAVDDNPDVLNITQCLLKAMGYAVDTATDGVEATQCLRRRQYGMVVTDMEMPNMDGFALACWIKRRAKNIKVVIMTGVSPANVDSQMNSNVADGWIFKPFGMNDLKNVLGTIRCLPSH